MIAMTHTEMDRQFRAHCKKWGWKAYHTRRSTGSDKGWPDWVASNGRMTIFVEFKVGTDKLTEDQYEWMRHLIATGNSAYVVRPCMFGDLLELIVQGRVHSPDSFEIARRLERETSDELLHSRWNTGDKEHRAA